MMWSDACIVQVQRSGSDDIKPSCSGLVLNSHRGLILTHSSVLWPVLDLDHRSRLLSNGQLQGHDLSKYIVTVIAEYINTSKKIDTSDSISLQPNKCAYDHKVKRSPQSLEQLSGTIKCVWKSSAFAETVQKMMPASDGWTFTEDDNIGKTNTGQVNNNNPEKQISIEAHKKESHTMDSDDTFQTLPFFMLIELANDNLILQSSSTLQLRSLSCHGERVVVVGTPFGSLSPEVFINSVSEGILSNTAGNHNEMLLTDARAIPGTEGGPIYGMDGAVIGLVVASLCWKSTEWIGLSIGCSLHAALTSLPHQDMVPSQIKKALRYPSPRPSLADSLHGDTISAALRQVALVRCGGCWGSAVVVDRHQGVLLTCGHVVRNSQTKAVSVLRTFPQRKMLRARVVFTSPPSEPYDLAVLRLEEPWSIREAYTNRPTVRTPKPGEAVFAVGHACFSEQLTLQPSITRGTVSKVIHQGAMPVIIQSTCAVHAGASGGPLVASNGTIVGLLACNTKDVVSGSSYPHINMSVPLVTIWPTIEKYLQSNEEAVLLGLRVKDSRVKALWALQGNLAQLHSKL